MMASKNVAVFVINVLLGMCISNVFAYELLRSVRGPVPRGMPIPIPIRPLDHSTIRRLSIRPIEVNPDSEPVFSPYHQAKHRPLQIMERISLPIDNDNWNRRRKENFNVLNFEAYKMKPSNEIALKPVAERIFGLIDQTEDDRDDIRPSSSSHHRYRSRNIPKKPKKSTHLSHMKEVDDLEFYRAFLEHQKYAAMAKKLKPKADPSSRLPIGIDFFEQKKKTKAQAFPPITYSPLYMNHLHRSQQYEDVEASNIRQVKLRHPDMLKNERIPSLHTSTTTLASIPTTAIMSVENETPTETIPPPLDMLDELEHIHGLASEPEMYKFTIDDVVVKPNAIGVVNHPFAGPVTLPPPSMHYQNTPNSYMVREHSNRHDIMPASANTIFEHQFDTHYQTQLNYPPKVYPRATYRRIEFPYKSVPIEASASSQQKAQKYSIEPFVITTQMTVATETEPSVAASMDQSVKASHETDNESKRGEKRYKKRRLNGERHKPNNSRKVNRHKDSSNNVEFSNSYSKRRTQGYNSEEEIATTPIAPVKSRHNKAINEAKQKEQKETDTTIAPKIENVKYFQ